MMIGWLFCLSLASLPLFEISDYRVFAICLPFDTANSVSLGKWGKRKCPLNNATEVKDCNGALIRLNKLLLSSAKEYEFNLLKYYQNFPSNLIGVHIFTCSESFVHSK